MLRLEGIDVKLGDFRLREISLNVKPGTYLALLGPTGTGKTVLLETIAGVYRPTHGYIYVKGRDVTHLAPEARHLGIVYQDYALFPHLTVFQNIAFGLRLKGVPDRTVIGEVEKMARFLDIAALLKRRPTRLSGGERQRVALARALVMDPYVLLLDEPLGALDRAIRGRIQNELKRIHTELGVTILHITHDLEEAFFLADRMAVMKDGSILQEGTPDEVCRRPRNRHVAELVGIENLIAARVEGGRLSTAMGDLDRRRLAAGEDDLPERIRLTLPGWSIVLFPEAYPKDYFWEGNLRIAGVHPFGTTGMVEVTLANADGENLKTHLSRREAQALASSLTIGNRVRVGLLGEGVHWVPAEPHEKKAK
jgi:ABC-type Fe3+/spermidine/putrescine transport system ATPase subunit